MKQKLLRTIATFVIGLVLLLALGILALDRLLPRFINLEELKAKIETSILQSTGIRAEVKTLAIHPTFFHGVRVVFDNNVLYDPASIKVVKAGQINVNVRYLPLIQHKTSISNISFDNIEVYIGEKSFLFHLKKPQAPSKDVYMHDARVEFNDYHIIVDRYFDGRNKYFMDGDYFSVSHLKSRKPLQIKGGGTGFFGIYHPNQRIGEITLSGLAQQAVLERPQFDWKDIEKFHLEIQKINLPTVASIFSSFKVPVQATGQLGYLYVDLQGRHTPKTLTIKGATTTATTVHLSNYNFRFDPGGVQFKTQFRLNPQLRVAALENIDFMLNSKHFYAITQGDVQLSETLEKTALNLRTKTSWLPIVALQLLPPLTPQQQRWLSALDGNFATDLTLKGNILKPSITGTVMLEKLMIRDLKHPGLLAKDLNGVLNIYSASDYELKSLSGQVAGAPLRMHARVNTNTKMANGAISASHINLNRLREIALLFLPQDTVFSRLATGGLADIDLTFQGPLSNPQLFGALLVKEGELYDLQQRSYLARHITGDLHFKQDMVSTTVLKALMGEAPIEVSGSLQRARSQMDVRVRGNNLDLAKVQDTTVQVAAILGKTIPFFRQYALAGNTSMDLRILGPFQKPSLVGTARLANVQMINRQNQLKLSGVAGDILFTQSMIAFPKVIGLLQGTPFTASGRIDEGYQHLAVGINAPNSNLSAVQSLLKTVAPSAAQQISMGGSANVSLNLVGPVQAPVMTGNIVLKGANISYLPRQLSFQNLIGTLGLRQQSYELDGLRGLVNGIPFNASGTLAKTLKQYRIALASQNVSLVRLQNVLADFAPAVGNQLKSARIGSGVADLNLILSPSYANGAGGTIVLRNVSAQPEQLGAPVKITRLRYNLENGQIQLPAGGVQVGNLRFGITGFATANGYQLHLVSQRLPISFFRDDKAFVEKLISARLPTIFNAQGDVKMDIRLSPAQKEATLQFFNAGASMKELKYPLYDINGTLKLAFGKTIKAFSDNLAFRYGNSPAVVSFDVNGLKDVYVETTGTMAPLLINDILLANGSSLVAYAAIPFDINLSGKVGKLTGKGEGNNLNMFFNFNIASLFSNPDLEKPVEAGDTSLNQANLSSVLQLVGNTLNVEQTRFKLGEGNSILVQGHVDNIFTPLTRHFEMSFLTEPVLDLAALAKQFNNHSTEGLGGKIAADLTFISDALSTGGKGTVTFDHVKSPILELDDLDGKIVFDGIKAFLGINHIQVPGVDVGFTATAVDLSRYPIVLTDFNLEGQQFIVALYTQWVTDVIMGTVKKGIVEQFFPDTGRVGPIPFEIRNGTLKVAEGIINNLIVQDYTSTFRLYSNTYFEMDHIRAKSAGGDVTGHFAMSPRDNNFMMVHLVIDKMKANAVTQILLNVSNQIFGDLSGLIDYTTEGQTPDDFLANTNGSADLNVENGRLPSIAKMENLLVAANTISGGLANLNLNSLFRLAAPFNTDYFAKLTGTFKMVDGMIYTDDMFSDGQNLDMKFTGKIRMVDGSADMLIHGEMDRDIGGILGPIGSFSFGRVLGILPPLRQIVSHIPGIGFIPGFGGPHGNKGVAFEVRVIGPAIDPGSIKDFHWVQ